MPCICQMNIQVTLQYGVKHCVWHSINSYITFIFSLSNCSWIHRICVHTFSFRVYYQMNARGFIEKMKLLFKFVFVIVIVRFFFLSPMKRFKRNFRPKLLLKTFVIRTFFYIFHTLSLFLSSEQAALFLSNNHCCRNCHRHTHSRALTRKKGNKTSQPNNLQNEKHTNIHLHIHTHKKKRNTHKVEAWRGLKWY